VTPATEAEPAASGVRAPRATGALEREDFLACIHCGLCLEACPTYRETLDEGESARGRIALLKSLALRELKPDADASRALAHCVLCASCQAACPSGVAYEWLISRARAHLVGAQAEGRERRWLRRWWTLFRRPRQLALTLRLVRWAARTGLASLGVRLFFPRPHQAHYLDLVASVRASASQPRRPRARRRLEAPADVLIFTGCVTPIFFPQVLAALESVLEKAGVAFATPRKQVCCGALHLHTGDLEGARGLARRNIAAFEAAGEGRVVVEAAGCAAALKEYGELLAGDPDFAERAGVFAARVRDATEYLAELRGPAALEAPPAAVPAGATRVVYQDACHLRHLQGITGPPRDLLDGLPGVTRVPAGEEDLCCGSGGVFNLLRPSMAARLGERKADALAATGAEIVVTANPGCRVQLEGRLRRRGIAMQHLIEVCDRHGIAPGAVR
jgi:glycolate oxidase iron-sulfur subunit